MIICRTITNILGNKAQRNEGKNPQKYEFFFYRNEETIIGFCRSKTYQIFEFFQIFSKKIISIFRSEKNRKFQASYVQ